MSDINPLLENLRLAPLGKKYELIFDELQLNEEQFVSYAELLWREGILTGITKEGCCGSGCAQNCVSYMDRKCSWKLYE
mgnify:CR=1 FL=1|tara:strand:- start:53228 stop:53464 length:237 start_codon:yes stop_codon:yes gene_type:complete